MSTNIDDILDRLRKVTQSGNGYKASCPAHDDNNPSLTIRDAGDKVLLKCHKGCKYEDILRALDLPLTPASPSTGQQAFIYRDPKGSPVGRVVRRTGSKRFHQERWTGNDWKAGLDGRRLPLYQGAAVRKAIEAGEPVFVVEGEKDVDRLVHNDLAATCNSGGAGNWKNHHSLELVGADVVVIGDNDEPGRNHVAQVVASLQRKAQSIKVIEKLPCVREKGDVSDYLDAGRTIADLVELVARTPLHDSRSLADPVIVNRETGVQPMWGFEAPPPLRWFVEGILPEGFPTILAADGGIGKSYLALYLASCVIRGRDFFGLPTVSGSVLFVDYELDVSEQRRRWIRVLAGLGITQHEPTLDGRFHYLRPTMPLSTDDGHDQVLRAKEECGADLVILDSLTIAMQADATSQKDVVSVMGRFREWGTVLAIDHISGQSASGNQSRARPFGSVFKRNIARSVLNLTKVDAGGLLLRATKTNFAEAADLVSFTQEFSSDGSSVSFGQVPLSSAHMIGSIDHLTATEITLLAVQELEAATAADVVTWRSEHNAPLIGEGTVRNHFTTLKRRQKINVVDGTAYPFSDLAPGTSVRTPKGEGVVVEGPSPRTDRLPVRLVDSNETEYFSQNTLIHDSRSRRPLGTVNRESR